MTAGCGNTFADLIRRAKQAQTFALTVLLAAVTIVVSPQNASAGGAGHWWEQLLGQGGQPGSDHGAASRRKRQKYKADFLRKGPIPLRSEEVFDATVAAIQRYQKIASAGGWKKIESRRMIRPGDDDPRVAVVRARLRATGDLAPSSGYFEGYTYGSTMEASVAGFQKRHGLRVTRRIDRATIAAMNVTAMDRLRHLRLNLERLRALLTGPIEDRYILVNAAAYQLEAVNRYTVERRHRVIVGKPGRNTPIIRATIKGLNFFPYWRVPRSVAERDLIPRLQTEPEYLEKENIRAYKGSYDGELIDVSSIDWSQVNPSDLFFRQEPGPGNALGVVRIDMPNSEVVYMHDTPMKDLFSQVRRAYSAGCVRVQDVLDLVDWIAQNELGWQQPGRADQVVAGGVPLDLVLTRPIPVYFTYVTAWGEPRGPIQFRSDIYDRDGSQVFAGEQNAEDPAFVPQRQVLAP